MRRIFDIIFSISAIMVLSPLFFAVALMVFIVCGRPILFAQERSGLKGKPFTMYKFRTMRNSPGLAGDQVSDMARLTLVGQVLRSTSLDEIPGFLNVLRGEMSVVGPRPLLPDYLPLYSPREALRHTVKPGITGWAQVNGRNALSWPERLELDAWYVENRSVWLDLKIILMTAWRVINRAGISAPGAATMPRFTGSNIEDMRS